MKNRKDNKKTPLGTCMIVLSYPADTKKQGQNQVRKVEKEGH
jgi:hypothetical protein